MKVLPNLKEAENEDHKLILEAFSMPQDNVSLALSCMQAQLGMQSTVTLVIREGSKGTFPIKIWKAVWENATSLERSAVLLHRGKFYL